MPADSRTRRIGKRIVHRLLDERNHRIIQALVKAWDIRSGTWTEKELSLVPLAVWPGDTALDIGANYGLYTYHLSRAVGPAGTVYAFEPVPFTSDTLRLVVRLLRLGNVQVVQRGVSDDNGTVAFTVPKQDTGVIHAGLAHMKGRTSVPRARDGTPWYERTTEIRCEVVRVDDFLPTSTDVAFVKCDIEGAELSALRGARATIERCWPSVVCEVSRELQAGFGVSVGDLVGFFLDRGYVMYRCDAPGRVREFRPASPEEMAGDNYVFVHPRRAHRLGAA